MPTTVWLAADALQRIQHDAEECRPLETGGVLMGWIKTEREEIVIVASIGAGPLARRGPTTFRPDDRWQDDDVARVYERSGRRVTYLGDWHTHPGGSMSLSPTDRATLFRIATNPAARAPCPLMLIVAGGDPWTATMWQWWPRRVWRCERRSARPLPCRVWQPEPGETVWD